MFEQNANEPKYKLIKTYIKNLIKEKIVKNGQMLPSEYELTEKFGVSRHTVRQAFGELAKEGWIYKEQGKGTFARHVNTGANKGVIGLITTYISDYIFPHIINGIESVMTDEGYVLIIANTNNNKEKEAYQIKSLMEQNIKGLILAAIDIPSYP
jgi:GntR family transcriptional regulator of arabinose operon